MTDRNPLVSFVGNLTRDPQIKTTSKGDLVEFGLAVSDGFGEDANVEFKSVAAWNEGLIEQIMRGDNGRPLLYKGAAVAVQGVVKHRPGYADDVSAVRVGTVTWLQRSKLGERPAVVAAPASDVDF